MLSSRLLVVHDPRAGSQDDVPELTRWQQLDNPFLQIAELDVISWRNDTGLVESTVELDDNLAGSVVVDFLEFANVACEVRQYQVAQTGSFCRG